MVKFLQKALPWLYGLAIIAAVYVVFFMPAGTGTAPVDSNNPSANAGEDSGPSSFNLYTYLNGVKSSRGKLIFDCDFALNNGDEFNVKSTQSFETKGANMTIVGSTAYTLNSDTAVFDDNTYIQDGKRYVKTPTGYVVSNNHKLDAGNLNLGKIEDVLDREGDVVLEDNISCYKYVGSIMYGDMSSDLRTFIRSQNVNVANIENLPLDLTIFVTEKYIPYKIVIEFQDASCMIKANSLEAKNGTATGSLTIMFSGFNGVEQLNYASDMANAQEGTYTFTDKVNRYMTATGQ